MKTIKTTFGNKTIHTVELFMLGSHIRKIISDHRAKLIDALLQNELNTYIDYTFNMKLDNVDLRAARHRLHTLKENEIGGQVYSSVYNRAVKYDYVVLNNTMFYEEIDAAILSGLNQRDLFKRERVFAPTQR